MAATTGKITRRGARLSRLALAARSGDPAARAAFAVECRGVVLGYIRSRMRSCRDHRDVEDLEGWAWVKVFEMLPRYDGRSAFTTWIYSGLPGACASLIQARGRVPLVWGSDLSYDALAHAADPRDPMAAIEAADELGAAMRSLESALAQINRRRAAVWRLRRLEGWTLAAVGKRFGLTRSRVQQIESRANDDLMRQLRGRVEQVGAKPCK